MDLLQLEHFVAVVEEGSFSRAAEKVFRTQPAISQSIKKLEEEVGAPVFARDMHDVALTEAGKLLNDYARRMLRLRDETLHALNDLNQLNAGSLTIAAPESAALHLLTGPLHAFLREYPAIKLGIYRRHRDEIPREVMDRQIDVGFMVCEPTFRELHCVPIYSDSTILISSPNHPLVGRRSVKIRDLGQERFILHHLCQPTLDTIEAMFAQAGTPLNIAAELWGFESIKAFVRQGIGLAIVPRIVAVQELENGTLARIRVEELNITRQTFMVYRDPRYMTKSGRELLRTIAQYDWTKLDMRQCPTETLYVE
ncbi:MAG: LysR family transcriptional regulator [Vicinamibacteria bacterium]